MHRLVSNLPIVLALISPLCPSECDEPKIQPKLAAVLMTFDALQEQLNAPSLRLLDARPRADYVKAHIPVAVWVDAKAVEKLAARPGGLEDKDAWQAWIAPLGITPQTEVLIYDANRQLDAARLWWLLCYLGVEKVGLIDGSFPLWQRQGRPVATEIAKVNPKPFRVTFRMDKHATRSEVLEAIKAKSAQIIDARMHRSTAVLSCGPSGADTSRVPVRWSGPTWSIRMGGSLTRWPCEPSSNAVVSSGRAGDHSLSGWGPCLGRCLRDGEAGVPDPQLLPGLVGLGQHRGDAGRDSETKSEKP